MSNILSYPIISYQWFRDKMFMMFAADSADSADKKSEAKKFLQKKLGAPFFAADSADSADKGSDPCQMPDDPCLRTCG